MTKAEVVREVAKSTGIESATVLAVVECFMSTVKNTLSNGEKVYLRRFGTFAVQTRAQKTARNIKKNTTLIIPEHKVPTFKPSDDFKSMIQ